jgi:glycosyltransferase involved in cell wall biosynthesis
VKVAIVHEWLTTLGGSELVVREMLRLYPDASVFTLIDKMAPDERAFVGVGKVTTSFLDAIPGVRSRYRSLLPLYPAAVRSLDVSGFDVVISSSHAVAKNVRTRDGQLHISYCHSPMRYAWDLREQYLREAGLATGVRGLMARTLLDSLQRWDRARSADVDAFVTNSHYVADRVRRAYGRTATVIYPPVDVDFFTPGPRDETLGDYYATVSRFVPYKRVDLIARAFARLPERKLVIVGDGPDCEKVRTAAGGNVVLLGRASRDRVRTVLRGARAFLFAAEEDFGIAPVEAQACGAPVIAYARGGALETVIGSNDSKRTGVFFSEQTPESIATAIRGFESLPAPVARAACRTNAERFSEARFRREFGSFVEREYDRFRAAGGSLPPS